MKSGDRTVTMEQAQDEALVFGVDDDGEFYGETAEGERLEIAEPATIMCDEGPDDHSGDAAEMVSVQQLQAEVDALRELLPGNRYSKVVRAVVSSDQTGNAEIWISCREMSDGLQTFAGTTFAEAISAARDFIANAPDRRRAAAERKLAEVQAELAALDAEA